MNLLDQILGIKSWRLAGAGTAAPNISGGRHGLFGDNDGRAGQDVEVLGVANLKARDVGDEIARTGNDHPSIAGLRSPRRPARSSATVSGTVTAKEVPSGPVDTSLMSPPWAFTSSA